MDERLKWAIILGGIALLLLGFYIGMGWIALILPLLWGLFVLWVFPREEQVQSAIYYQDQDEGEEDEEDDDEDWAEDEEEDEDEEGGEEDEDNMGWIVAYCPDCRKKIRHKVDLETRYATCTLCGRRWKYKGDSW